MGLSNISAKGVTFTTLADIFLMFSRNQDLTFHANNSIDDDMYEITKTVVVFLLFYLFIYFFFLFFIFFFFIFFFGGGGCGGGGSGWE